MSASTLYEVAQRAGVSLATASRVLNGSARRPGDAISERVRRAAGELGYIANAQAQALAKSSTGMIGLVLHDISDPYFSTIARGVQEAAHGQGKAVLLASTGGTPSDERDAIATFAARRADAIVIAGSRTDTKALQEDNKALAAELRRYVGNGGKVVIIGQPVVGAAEGDRFSTVQVPNTGLARQLALQLAASGHRRFLVLAGPEGLATSDDRLAGFQQGLAEAGLEPAQVRRTGFNRDGGYKAAVELAAGRVVTGRPEADGGPGLCVFAANDVMAIGAIAGFREHGLEVPRDVAVAGFDDIETLRDFTPALSTAQLPLSELGRRAVAQVLGADQEADASDQEAEASAVDGVVVLRRSTAAG